MQRQLSAFFRILLAVAVFFSYLPVIHAGVLPSVGVTLDDSTAGATTNYTVDFTTATSDDLKNIRMRFSTTNGGTTKPLDLNLASVTLGSVSGIDASWTLDTAGAASGYVALTRSSTESIAASTAISIELVGVENSVIDDCEPGNNGLHDTCHIAVTTYSDDGTTVVDTGSNVYTITEDPNLTFEVEDVPSGQTHNGVTSTVSSTSTSLALGRVRTGSVVYATQKLTITTNAPGGYTVYAYLDQSLTGLLDVGSVINPFGATGATWTTPVTWSSPTGTAPNTNTGWIGANTSDVRVTGWSSGGSGKFGPLSTIPKAVAYSTGDDRNGSVVYVSYAFEVNALQPSDQYVGHILYDVRANY